MIKNKVKQIKKLRYYIEGMHCLSCELLIEKRLLRKFDNIKDVDASLDNRWLDFSYTGSAPNPEQMTAVFEENGYQFSVRKTKIDTSPLISFNGKNVKINSNQLYKIIKTFLFLIIFILAFKIVETSGLLSGFSVSSSTSYPTFFVFGIIAGLSSCAALIGGLLLSLSKRWNEIYIDSESKLTRLAPFIMFNVGRILSFTVLGGVLGWLGSKVGFSLDSTSMLTAIVIILISIFMLIMGLQMLEVSWARNFQLSLPKFISRKISRLEDFEGKYLPLLTGFLTFFLPCGFTITAQALAMASGSFFSGSMILMFFSLGTLPMLAFISITSAHAISKPKFNDLFNKVGGILVLIFAIYNINSQLNVIGLFSLSDIKLPETINVDVSRQRVNNRDIVPDVDGVQRIRMVADKFRYAIEGGNRIKAGIPAQLIVNNTGIQGCGAYLYARGLVNTYSFLKDGENIFEIPNPQKGVYKVTCTMGMVPPVTIEVF